MDENNFVTIPTLFTRPAIPVNNDDIPTQEDIDGWPHLEGIKVTTIEAEIGLLIACDVPEALDPHDVCHSHDGGPYASKTLLGWTINGPLGHLKKSSNFGTKTDKVLTQMIETYYNHDFDDSALDSHEASLDERRFLTDVNKSCKLIDGHYTISLPFKDKPPNFPNNKEQVILRSNWLKRKLLKNDKLLLDYKTFMNDLLSKDYAEEVTPERLERDDGKIRYLPHHGVYHPHKPGKVRVVFDCSAKYQGMSLNDKLLKGPDLINPLVGVLTRFRQYPIATMADIESMFHQVRVTETDRDVFRFLWWPDGNLNLELKTYRMNVHLFGAVSSPSIANYALRRSAEDNQGRFDNNAVQTVLQNFYVDDCMKSHPTVEEAIANAKEVRELLSKGGFRLTKWISNNLNVLESIPQEERAKCVKELDLTREVILPVERALGVRWCVDSDHFGFSVTLTERPPTRRGILSIVSSIYDPLGLIAPVILPAKLILQDLTRRKLGWDDEIPPESLSKWEKWKEDLSKLTKFTIERNLMPPNFDVVIHSELHQFSDASQCTFGSVCYLRLTNDAGDHHCSFLMGKARLAPLKQITIPRLELSAATISVKLNVTMKKELDLPIDESVYWSDSTSVLCYIENENRRYHTFVANRCTYIRERSEPSQWRYVETKLNPADNASRGLSTDDLISSRWIKGPEFLWGDKRNWPERPQAKIDVLENDPEVKKETRSAATLTTRQDPVEEAFLRFWSWYNLKRKIALWLRYLSKLKNAITKKKQGHRLEFSPEVELITVNEMEKAENTILLKIQSKAYPEEIRDLTRAQKSTSDKAEKELPPHVKKTSTVAKLDPVLLNNLLRVGGRLSKAKIPEHSYHQIILPKNHHVTKLLIEHHHELAGHSGRQHVLSLLREKYWIVRANSAVRRVLNDCVSCRRRQAKHGQQKMADLPVDRTLSSRPPFTAVGLDYFGPFFVCRGRSLVKRYGVIFTCLCIRAVHIEIAYSLETDSFIMALRRFIARRGQVQEIRSDNGTNLTGGEKNCAKL